MLNDLLDIILTNKTLEPKSQENENKKENEKVESKKEENEDEDYENENEYENEDHDYKSEHENEDEDENEDDDYKKENEDEYENENEDDDEIMSENKKKQNNKRKKWSFRWNNWQIKIIWRANKIVKKDLEEYGFIKNYDDKELKSKIFKLKLAHLSNIIEEKLFEQIFGHTLIKVVDKLINTTNNEENQIIV